jgi:hypothetical protein
MGLACQSQEMQILPVNYDSLGPKKMGELVCQSQESQKLLLVNHDSLGLKKRGDSKRWNGQKSLVIAC